MKALILAAGYGTRLDRDLRSDTSGKYAHLIGVPKPLLPIGKQPLISHWLQALQGIHEIDAVYVVTNSTNHSSFEAWAKEWDKVQLLCDGSVSNETRIGAIGCINLTVQHFNIQDDLMVIGGDNLFYDDFKLKEILQTFQAFKLREPDSNMVLSVAIPEKDVSKYGIIEMNDQRQIIQFLEKPQPNETTSRTKCPCFYIYSKNNLPLLQQFLEEKKDCPLRVRDAPGNFIAYIYKMKPVFAVPVSGCYDVGGLKTYIACHEEFLQK